MTERTTRAKESWRELQLLSLQREVAALRRVLSAARAMRAGLEQVTGIHPEWPHYRVAKSLVVAVDQALADLPVQWPAEAG